MLDETVLTSPEVSFFKLLALLVALLWAVYLVKEIFFANREDPRINSLITSTASLTTQIAGLAVTVQFHGKQIETLVAQRAEDWRELQEVLNSVRQSLTHIAQDHAELEGRLSSR